MKKDGLNQFGKIPNDEEGQYFLHLLKKYLNKKDYSIVAYGRKPDHKKIKKDKVNNTFKSRLPLKYAQQMGLYLIDKKTGYTVGAQSSGYLERLRQEAMKNWREKKKHDYLAAKIAELNEIAKAEA